MAGFIVPIVQGLTALREFQDQNKIQEAAQEEQQKQDLQRILISKFLEREEL